MKTIYQINKFALQLVALFTSVVGLIALMIFLTLFDGISNALAISEVFQDRMINLVMAWDMTLNQAEARSVSKIISFVFSILASGALGLSIMVTAMQQPTDDEKQGNNPDRGSMQRATTVLSWISFFMSFIGYMIFLSKGKSWQDMMSLYFSVQIIMAILLASFVPYLFAKVSIYMRDKYGSLVDAFVNDLTTQLTVKIKAQIAGLSEQDTQKILKQTRQQSGDGKRKTIEELMEELQEN